MTAGARVWITRTLPGAETTAARLLVLGYQPVIAPLLEVRPIQGAMHNAPSARDVACLALTSPNTIEAIKADAQPYLSLPAYAVGDTTALAATAAGFRNVKSAAGDINALADLIRVDAPTGTVFAPGAQQPAGNLPALLPDRQVIRLPVYATKETVSAIPEDTQIALVHSPRAAQALARLLQDAPCDMTVIAISEAAARPFAAVHGVRIATAEHPDEEAMLRTLGNSTSGV